MKEINLLDFKDIKGNNALHLLSKHNCIDETFLTKTIFSLTPANMSIEDKK